MLRHLDRLRLALSLIAALSLAAAMGCSGDDGPPRVGVRGTVTYRGQPLPSGDIRFVPLPGTDTPQAGARIVDGRYAVAGGGVPVGEFRVEILGYRRSDGSAGPVDLNDAEAAFDQFLPANYNTASELRLTIVPGSKDIEKNFEL